MEPEAKNDWHLDIGPMSVWCEYEENRLKTPASRVHTAKMHLAPWWPQMELQSNENLLVSRPWSHAYLV